MSWSRTASVSFARGRGNRKTGRRKKRRLSTSPTQRLINLLRPEAAPTFASHSTTTTPSTTNSTLLCYIPSYLYPTPADIHRHLLYKPCANKRQKDSAETKAIRRTQHQLQNSTSPSELLSKRKWANRQSRGISTLFVRENSRRRSSSLLGGENCFSGLCQTTTLLYEELGTAHYPRISTQ